MIGAGVAQVLIRRLGVRNVSAVGFAVATAGLLILTQLPVHGSYVANLLVGLMPLSLGLGLAFVPITLMGTSGVRAQDQALPRGCSTPPSRWAARWVLRSSPRWPPPRRRASCTAPGRASQGPAARVSGYHVAFLGAAIMMAAGVGLLAFALRRSHIRRWSWRSPPAGSRRWRWRIEPARGGNAPADPKRDNGGLMEDGTRRLRADAERNRSRLLDAANEMFGERGPMSAWARSPAGPVSAAERCFGTSRQRRI